MLCVGMVPPAPSTWTPYQTDRPLWPCWGVVLPPSLNKNFSPLPPRLWGKLLWHARNSFQTILSQYSWERQATAIIVHLLPLLKVYHSRKKSKANILLQKKKKSLYIWGIKIKRHQKERAQVPKALLPRYFIFGYMPSARSCTTTVIQIWLRHSTLLGKVNTFSCLFLAAWILLGSSKQFCLDI